MCFGGGSTPSTTQYSAQEPTVIAPPTTTVEIDESDIGNATKDESKTVGRNTLRNDLTASNMGNPIAGQGLNLLRSGGRTAATSGKQAVRYN